MKFRFGAVFLLVALAFAIVQVNSEEANAQTIIRREADPGFKKILIEALKKKMGKREADPGFKKILIEALKKKMGKREADPGLKDLLLKVLKKKLGKREADPGLKDLLLKVLKKKLGKREADPGVKPIQRKMNKKLGKRNADPRPPPRKIQKLREMRKGRDIDQAIDRVDFEETNAETMVRREADPGLKDKIMGYIGKKLKKLFPAKRSADPNIPPKKMERLRKKLKEQKAKEEQIKERIKNAKG